MMFFGLLKPVNRTRTESYHSGTYRTLCPSLQRLVARTTGNKTLPNFIPSLSPSKSLTTHKKPSSSQTPKKHSKNIKNLFLHFQKILCRSIYKKVTRKR